MPRFAIIAYGIFCSMISAITGKAPSITYRMSQISCDGHYYSPAKAINELMLPQTPVSVAIEEAYEWFKNNNKI